MKSNEEMREFLENLMRWGLDRPWMYGGSPYSTHNVFWQWRMIWAELTERSDKFNELTDGENNDLNKPVFTDHSRQPSTDPAQYKPVTDFWRAVDQRLGINHPSTA